MKISYLLNTFGRTGGHVVLYNFMDNLIRRGHDVVAVLPGEAVRWDENTRERILRAESAPRKRRKKRFHGGLIERIRNIESVRQYRIFQKIKNLSRDLIRNWSPSDVTISTYSFTAYAGYCLAEKTVPLYHMQHFEEVFFQEDLLRQVARHTYHLPLIQMANSIWLKTIMKKHFGSDAHLLNPGIDLDVFRPSVRPRDKYREDKKEWVIVSYMDEGRLWKGFRDAATAVSLARKQLAASGIRLVWKVFGLSAPAQQYETEFVHVGQVFGRDLAALYSQADIVLVPSWYESFPLPPLEAMASGSLVITTRYGTEDYVADGQNGLVVLPRKPEDMAERIVSAVERPADCLRMADAGLETVKNYSWGKRTDVLERILDDSRKGYSFTKFQLFDDLVKGDFKKYMHEEFSS